MRRHAQRVMPRIVRGIHGLRLSPGRLVHNQHRRTLGWSTTPLIPGPHPLSAMYVSRNPAPHGPRYSQNRLTHSHPVSRSLSIYPCPVSRSLLTYPCPVSHLLSVRLRPANQLPMKTHGDLCSARLPQVSPRSTPS